MATVHDLKEDELSRVAPARAARGLIWLAFVAGWTAALLSPHPVGLAQEMLPEATLAPSFKSAHVLCYAVMTVLGAWLRLGPRWRGPLLAFVSGHAFLTEFFQQFVPGRSASWMDVGIDHLGILLGLVLLRALGWDRDTSRPDRAGA